jgi:hypothetical protein
MIERYRIQNQPYHEICAYYANIRNFQRLHHVYSIGGNKDNSAKNIYATEIHGIQEAYGMVDNVNTTVACFITPSTSKKQALLCNRPYHELSCSVLARLTGGSHAQEMRLH